MADFIDSTNLRNINHSETPVKMCETEHSDSEVHKD